MPHTDPLRRSRLRRFLHESSTTCHMGGKIDSVVLVSCFPPGSFFPPGTIYKI